MSLGCSAKCVCGCMSVCVCVCRYSATVYLPRVPRVWSSCDRMCFHVSGLCVRCGAVRRVPSVRMWRGHVNRLCGRVFPGALHSCFDKPWSFYMCGLGILAGHVDSWCVVPIRVSALSRHLRLSWVCTTITASSVFACWGNILVVDSSGFTGLVCRLCSTRVPPFGSIISSALGGWNDVMMLLLLLSSPRVASFGLLLT
jgi:hypothetical protein